tara:strand:+ start:32820 stop:33860 length:1041 start_codon:yes stop_codon:yes gene_type:complete
MLVDAASQIDVILDEDKIKQKVPPRKGVRRDLVDRVLNSEPNPFQDISSFRRLLYTDLITEGNAFIYFDGVHIYHLPAHLTDILTDETVYIKGYKCGTVYYEPEEVIHVRDNSVRSIYRGASRLKASEANMKLLARMVNFQDTFFSNGAIPGLILKSENALSEKIKEKMIESWLAAYSPNNGGKRPLILDGGLELDKLSNSTFRELDFDIGIKTQEKAILTSLGIPPILLEGGNNANIRPNQRLFYIETVIPLVDKLIKAFERYFGYKLIPDNDIPGMQPELQEMATYASTLVNGGIITVNEGRKSLAYDDMDGEDELRVPQNIAGSAVDPSMGGKPKEPKKDDGT